ncbi:response regulator transcription factor [Gayadomonas joobiniege]|uniref:response regulator transcription factor n=1 Tax=Gayadomonas joobiniege TaxID=1234606 RepID=UPI0003684EF4|nr:response regulator transcription factor [Gayadomonas joobiniege]
MASARILIIEDDTTMNEQISTLLSANRFDTTQCFDGDTGLQTALNSDFDIILLDWLLPKLDGLKLLQRLRLVKDTPVMMITASGAEQQRIEGYRTGADDYLPKPFNFTEMIVRIEALLRRTGSHKLATASNNSLQLHNLFLNNQLQQVKVDQQAVELTQIQFKLLWVLASNQNEVLSKEYLYHTVLHRPFNRYDRSLDMHLSRVRKKLQQAGFASQHFTTVHGKGYCLR